MTSLFNPIFEARLKALIYRFRFLGLYIVFGALSLLLEFFIRAYLIDIEIEQNEQKTIVTWRVKESKNKFYVIDLIVADVSLVVTKRAEFSSMLKKVDNNLGELNNLLKDQNLQSYNKLIN